jgi:ZIP family zinc transporter
MALLATTQHLPHNAGHYAATRYRIAVATDGILYIVVLTFAAGLCMPLGGWIASFERIQRRWLEKEVRHFLIALGGGLLLGAVYEVLLPEGLARFGNSVSAVLLFVAGGLLVFLLERLLAARRRESPQLLGMLLDYVPESIALGGLIATDPSLALVLAIVIGLQNLPEGFNAYRELAAAGRDSSAKVLSLMCLLTLLGPLAGLSAYAFLADVPAVLGAIMLSSAGGIVYLMFQDIAPQAHLNRHWAPPLGAVLGFAFTLLTSLWLGHG